MDLPHRYDLVEWSCVNSEVRKTNALIKDLSNKDSNVTVVEVSKAERKMHTRHGQAEKRSPARQMCDAVACNICQLLPE